MAFAVFALMFAGTSTAWAGSPHFVKVSYTVTDNTLTVQGKEAGLGNETQVHIVVSATAECINPGGHHPKAANKASFTAEGDFPVQNGRADFSLTLTATFQPDCSPPMTVKFTSITVEDVDHNVFKRLL
ncbi:hypothetical protein [Glycomyces sp. NPDC048151]|uniref:hypothetical protein n=1 Tax=Glycomyces sp. NPDC048151 TaxID=3364002 RepID=UPI0037127185